MPHILWVRNLGKNQRAGEALSALAVAEVTRWRQWVGGLVRRTPDGSLECQGGGWRLGWAGGHRVDIFTAALGLKGSVPTSKVGTAWSRKAWPWKSQEDTFSHTPLVSVGTHPDSRRGTLF